MWLLIERIMGIKSKEIDTGLNFDNSFIKQLNGFYIPTSGEIVQAPKLIKLNHALADELGLEYKNQDNSVLANLLSGSIAAKGAQPIAQAYAGHQFGGFSPQLGDGRAILLGEVIDKKGNRRDIHLKGSGQTPFSRGGDGKAGIGPVLREYILGEAMHALNIPATRGLAVTLTGEQIVREQLQNGAVLARVANSHIRVGTFQYFAARNEPDKVKLLADYTINRHFPEIAGSKDQYRKLLSAVRDKQADLIAQWVLIGFVHGVMNTDNMAISGETIDFGPCAFIDNYDPQALYSSIDREGRYALGNQPYMAQWNTARFAETLLPLLDDNNAKAIEIATEEIQTFTENYQTKWLSKVSAKLGLSKAKEGDIELTNSLFKILELQNVDYTQFFRSLSQAIKGEIVNTQKLFNEPSKFDEWYEKWLKRLKTDSGSIDVKIDLMNATNPIYIPRNHLVEEAILAAEQENNFEPFEKLLTVLACPYEKRTGLERFADPAPKEFGPYKTFCGT
jgi:uncharacterized protein YdiU (UPF0061 family)